MVELANSGPEPGSLADRMRTDPYPEIPLPRVAANGVLRRSPAVITKVLGTVVGAAIGDAMHGGAVTSRGAGWSGTFGLPTAAAIVEAQCFLAALDLDEASMAVGFRAGLDQELRVRDMASIDTPESLTVSRSALSIARWSFVNITGTATIARLFAGLSDASALAAESRAVLHMLMQGAVPGADQRDPFRLPGHMGAGPTTGLIVKMIDDQYVDSLRAAIDMTNTESLDPASAIGCLAHAIRAFRSTDSFEDCVDQARQIRSGDSGVTTVAGLIAGGTYGLDQIPDRWVARLSGTAGGESYDADRLCDLTREVLAAQQ